MKNIDNAEAATTTLLFNIITNNRIISEKYNSTHT